MKNQYEIDYQQGYDKAKEEFENIFQKIAKEYNELRERTVIDLIKNYDFLVGSIECKHRLMEVLPEGANIRCTPYIEDPTTIYVIKKFNIMDLLKESEEV